MGWFGWVGDGEEEVVVVGVGGGVGVEGGLDCLKEEYIVGCFVRVGGVFLVDV